MEKIPTTDEQVGRILRDLRMAKGWTQGLVANRMTTGRRRWHQTTVGKIESGTRPLTLSEAIDLAVVLDVAVEALFTPDTAAHAARLSDIRRAVNKFTALEKERFDFLGEAALTESKMEDWRGRLDVLASQIQDLTHLDPNLAAQVLGVQQRMDRINSERDEYVQHQATT
jgi:transcriptional regulator with XRE-family HTH domain